MKTIEASAPVIKELAVKAPTTEGFDLYSFGVSPAYQGRSPTGISFPAGLNPSAQPIWLELFDDPVFHELIKPLTPGEQWVKAIEHFLAYCRKDGVEPFKQSSPEAMNDAVRQMLYDRRRTLVRYLYHTQLLAVTRYIRYTERHHYKWMANGAVRLIASLQFRMSSRTALEAFARSSKGMRMFRDGEGNFTRNLIKNLTVNLKGMQTKRATLEYTLEIRPPFYLPDNLTTKQDRHAYMDRQFFFPMIRGQRVENLPVRTKF